MNIENEKKWFIYLNDHHEGPFSVAEVFEHKKAGNVTNESYVWAEGMNDWIVLTEAKELAQELKKLEPVQSKPAPMAGATPLTPKAKATPAPTPAAAPAPSSVIDEKPKSSLGRKLPIYLAIFSVLVAALAFGGLVALSRYAPEDMHAKLRPFLGKVTTSVPAVSSLFHLIPTLPDITPEEQKDLEQARSGTPDVTPKIAIALSQNDLNRPYFYISTNLPDHTKFDVYLIGNSETLLNKLQYANQNTVTTLQGFGKTEPFLADAGQLIPKGEFQVVVIDSTDQTDANKSVLAGLPPLKPTTKLPDALPQNTHFAISKVYFLGGKRDETYLTRLKQFHEKIKANADRELLELKQYSDTLNVQFSTLTTEFNRIYQAKKPNPSLKAAWTKDAQTWQQINTQLDQTVQTWSKETIQNEFFYGKVYSLVKSAYDSTKALFALENGFVQTPVDHATFDVQHGKALSETRDALELLRTKMDLIMKAPKTPSGLPTREGL